MFKALLICTVVCAAAVACASSPQPQDKPVAAYASIAGCVQSGSRIPAKDEPCVGPGRTYTQTDIDRTGQTDAGNALRLLDPTVSVHH